MRARTSRNCGKWRTLARVMPAPRSAAMTDKIIRFPGSGTRAPVPEPAEENLPDGLELAGLTPEQRKAVGIVLSGMPFVVVGIKATNSGADFFTSLGGDDADLRNAHPHLSAVVDRAFTRRGL